MVIGGRKGYGYEDTGNQACNNGGAGASSLFPIPGGNATAGTNARPVSSYWSCTGRGGQPGSG